MKGGFRSLWEKVLQKTSVWKWRIFFYGCDLDLIACPASVVGDEGSDVETELTDMVLVSVMKLVVPGGMEFIKWSSVLA